MPFANLNDAIAKLRAASSGSSALDGDVKSYVGIGGNPPDFRDYSHGHHAGNPIPAAIICLLKFRESRA